MKTRLDFLKEVCDIISDVDDQLIERLSGIEGMFNEDYEPIPEMEDIFNMVNFALVNQEENIRDEIYSLEHNAVV